VRVAVWYVCVHPRRAPGAIFGIFSEWPRRTWERRRGSNLTPLCTTLAARMKRPRSLLGLGRPYVRAVLVDGGRAAARSSAPPPAVWRRRGTRTAAYATLLQLDKTDARWRCELRQILRSSAQLPGKWG
jgi:hypothetical protein